MKTKTSKLKCLSLNVTDGEHGSISDDLNGDYWLLSNKNILNGHIVITDVDRKISKEIFEKINKRTKLAKDDVVVSSVGRIGKTAIVETNKLNFDFQRSVGIIKCNTEKIIPEYLFYYLQLNWIQAKLLNTSLRSIQKCLYINDIENIEITYPENIGEQKNIVSILKSLDDKIANNNRINTELESLAKTIYDYWFVQFEFPNEDGKPYKSSGGKMVWRDRLKREIPDGWDIKEIQEIEPNIITGRTPLTSNPQYYGGNIPFITIDDIRGNMFIVETELTLAEEGANTQNNKFIPEGSICITCIATPGLVGFTTRLAQTNQQINTIVCDKQENKYYLFFALRDFFKYSTGAKTGNTFYNMSKGDFSKILLVCPKADILNYFYIKTNEMFEKIKLLSVENKELSKMRDFLLPILMNGQVTIK